MKLAFSSNSNGFKKWLPRSFRVSLYSTEAKISKPKVKKDSLSKPKVKKDSLSKPKVKRDTPLGDPRIEQGNSVTRDQRSKLPSELSQWISDRRCFVLTPGDVADRLGLIAKLHGVEAAETYFSNIPKQYKHFPVYFSLLNCYQLGKCVEKGEALMQQMRELGFAESPLAYNAMLKLYSRVGQYEKLDPLMDEMNEKGVTQDEFTFSIRLNAYADNSEIDGMEKILQRMEVDPTIYMNWICHAIAANGYIKGGLKDKALEMLKKSEKLITGTKRGVAYEILLTLYAATGSKMDLYRIWDFYKSKEEIYNSGYSCMISSLLKLDDIAGAEKILDEWESGGTYNFRVPNKLLSVYCKSGLMEKAETFINKAVVNGKKPFASTWEIMATGYIKANQIPKAVEAIKEGYSVRRPGWKPNRDILAACLLYLKEEGDVVKTEEFVRLLGAPGHMSTDDIERLLDYVYVFSNEDINESNETDKNYNSGYSCMITSLLKLDDIAGAEKILDEWESGGTSYDFRVPNKLLSVYCESGLMEKAETFINKAVENGKKPFASTWEIMATGYIKANQIPKAVEAIKAGYSVRRPVWKPNRDTLAACLLYLKEEGDAVKTEEFVRLLGVPVHMSMDDMERFLDYVYVFSNNDVNESNETDGDESDDIE